MGLLWDLWDAGGLPAVQWQAAGWRERERGRDLCSPFGLQLSFAEALLASCADPSILPTAPPLHRVKTRTERKGAPCFSALVEVLAASRWRVHTNVARSVDDILAGRCEGCVGDWGVGGWRARHEPQNRPRQGVAGGSHGRAAPSDESTAACACLSASRPRCPPLPVLPRGPPAQPQLPSHPPHPHRRTPQTQLRWMDDHGRMMVRAEGVDDSRLPDSAYARKLVRRGQLEAAGNGSTWLLDLLDLAALY